MEKDTSQPNSPDSNQDAILEKIKRMEQEIIDISKKRNQKTVFSLIGILLLLGILGTFVFNLWKIVQNYDQVALMGELQKHAENLREDDRTKKLINNIQTEVIPLLRDEIVKELRKRKEEIHKKAALSAKNLHEYLKNDIHAKLMKEVSSSVKDLEKDIMTRYPKIPPERIHEILQETKVDFIDKLTEALEGKVEIALQDITILNRSLDKVKDDPEYAKLEKEKIGEIENQLIESMLELTIYNMNPEKGRQPAFPSEGGAK